jgi:hypothetical protein
MTFPFWLLIVVNNLDAGAITSVTPFQTKAECVSSQRVIEGIKPDQAARFNVFDAQRSVLCETVTGRERLNK